MRLNPQQLELLSFELAQALLEKELVSGAEDRIARAVARAMAEDLAVEDALDAEVHEILKTYDRYLRENGVEYSEMFEKIKRKLARERKLTL